MRWVTFIAAAMLATDASAQQPNTAPDATAAAATAAAEAAAAAVQVQAHAPYATGYVCIVGEALRYEPSGERLEDIVDAAVTQCTEIMPAKLMPDTPGFPAIVSDVKLMIVQRRACRNTQGCIWNVIKPEWPSS